MKKKIFKHIFFKVFLHINEQYCKYDRISLGARFHPQMPSLTGKTTSVQTTTQVMNKSTASPDYPEHF